MVSRSTAICEGDSCQPHHRLKRSLYLQQPLTPTIALSFLPLIFSFTLVAYIAWRKLFPLLSGQDGASTTARRPALRLSQITSSIKSWLWFLFDKAAAIAFSITLGLSAVLAELIFCEISDLLEPAARSLALEATISILLVSLIIVMPALEIHSIINAAGWKLSGLKRGTIAIVCVLDIVGLVGWLLAFWWLGRAVLAHPLRDDVMSSDYNFSEGSLERIGVIGISLMASLAGFAAVSSLWQTFGVKVRKVTDTDVARKENGLQATTELLNAKQSRLRALEMKLNNSPTQTGLMDKIIGKIRGNAETQELATLHLEIDGLETMQMSLSNSSRLLKARREAQLQAGTPIGRVCISTSYLFSLYCLYRIGATLIATLRRWRHPSASFATTDPINNFLALIAKHWDPSIDRAAWSRQISFLLSGLMLLASFNAVLQTVLLFSRFTPTRILHSAQQNFALLVSQISATYVVSTALLLRSNLPKEMGSVIEGALGAPLDTAFVERWFEGWFLGACIVTAVGIWAGRSLVGTADWDDDVGEEADLECGKRS